MRNEDEKMKLPAGPLNRDLCFTPTSLRGIKAEFVETNPPSLFERRRVNMPFIYNCSHDFFRTKKLNMIKAVPSSNIIFASGTLTK